MPFGGPVVRAPPVLGCRLTAFLHLSTGKNFQKLAEKMNLTTKVNNDETRGLTVLFGEEKAHACAIACGC